MRLTKMQIIHNPGMIADARYLRSCNQSVVFEGAYSTYLEYGFNQSIPAYIESANVTREALAVIIHAIPQNFSDDGQTALLTELKKHAGSVFITGLELDYYSSFWQGWEGFVTEMD